jgi:hypothetical protein
LKKKVFLAALAATLLPFALAQTSQPATPPTPSAPAGQEAPAVPAQPPEAMTQPAPVSYLTSITFPRPAARPAGDLGNRSVSESVAGLSSVVKELVGPESRCGTGEVVFWEIEDQAEGVELVGAINARLRAFGYNLELLDSGTYGVTAVVVFAGLNPRQDVFGVWGLQPGGLSLAWCRLEGRR